MTDVLEAPARPAFANFVAGRPSEAVGEFPASAADDVDAAVRAAAEGRRRVSSPPRVGGAAVDA